MRPLSRAGRLALGGAIRSFVRRVPLLPPRLRVEATNATRPEGPAEQTGPGVYEETLDILDIHKELKRRAR